jgi:hypothetical protein
MFSQEHIDRFNKYKSLRDHAANACVRSYLHLIRPAEGFPHHSDAVIKQTWADWKDAEETFWRMTGSSCPPNHVFPVPPPDDAEHSPCRQMWGLLIQHQVEHQSFQVSHVKDAVAAIISSEACPTHPATCSCKVPNNPWTSSDCLKILEPLNVKHNLTCQCAGYKSCRQVNDANLKAAIANAEAEIAANPELDLAPCRCDAQYCGVTCSCLPSRLAEAKAPLPVTKPIAPVTKQSPYDYKHQVDTCACGTCYKARVDSGTQHLYEKRCRDATDAAMVRLRPVLCAACKASASGSCVECYTNRYSYDASGRLKMPDEIRMLRQAYYMEEQWYMNSRRQKEEAAAATAAPTATGFVSDLTKASNAISAAAAKSGGVTGEDFAKNLFAAMGTPHDSKCPHGLPFYACMPCSH